MIGTVLTKDGADTGTANSSPQYEIPINYGLTAPAGTFYVTDNDDATLILGGSFMGNACFTRATTAGNVGNTNADDATMGLGGGIALIPTCVTLAADGYTNTGSIYIGRAGAQWLKTDDESPFKNVNLYNSDKLDALTGLATDVGEYGNNNEKFINHGSVAAMGFTGETTNSNFIYLVTANQYYSVSILIATSLKNADLSGITVEESAAMANGTFG